MSTPKDDRWKRCEGTWDRLRWARMQTDFQTAEAAAESLGIKPGTYRAYERRPGASKHIDLDHQNAVKIGRKFKVSWIWLLTGEGSPHEGVLPEAQERVLTVMQTADPERQADIAELVERLFKAAG